LKKKIIGLVKICLPTLVGIYLFWFFYDQMSPGQKTNFFKKIGEVNYWWIFLSFALSLLSHVIRAHRWKYLLEPMGYSTSFWQRFHAIMVGYVMNILIPRAGEASRAGMLVKSNKIPFAKTFGTIIAERAIDMLLLSVVFFISIYLSYSDFLLLKEKILPKNTTSTSESSSLWWILGTILGAVLILFFILKPSLRKKIIGLLLHLKEGILSIFKSKNPIGFIVHSLLIWIIYIFVFWICFFSLNETKDVPFNGVLLGFVGGTVGVIITNGGVGLYPIIVGSIITFYAFPDYTETATHDTAYALATITWAVQTVMLIILGLISLFYFSRTIKLPLEDENSESNNT
jgi:glycosyltransferase 2 family protein